MVTSSAWRLLGGSQGWLHMLRLSFSQFSCSGGPMDPHSRARLVDKVLPSIDEAFMLMGCVSFSYEAVKWTLLIHVLACDWLEIHASDHTCLFHAFWPKFTAHIFRPAFIEFVSKSSYANIYSVRCSYFARYLTVKIGQNRPSIRSPIWYDIYIHIILNFTFTCGFWCVYHKYLES